MMSPLLHFLSTGVNVKAHTHAHAHTQADTDPHTPVETLMSISTWLSAGLW